MKKTIYIASILVFSILGALTAPYVAFPLAAKRIFPGDYSYAFPDYSARYEIEPPLICTKTLADLDPFRLLLAATNSYLNISRPGIIPIYAGIHSDGEAYVWSFRNFAFVKASEGAKSSITFACGTRPRWDGTSDVQHSQAAN